MKKSIVIVIIILVVTSVFFVWQRGWLRDGEESTIILREDLPPAPAGYKTLKEDPAFVAEIPADIVKKYREGFDEIIKTIEEHPDSFGAWFNMGSIKSVFGDFQGAEEAWLYATQISPLQARSLMNLGDLRSEEHTSELQSQFH